MSLSTLAKIAVTAGAVVGLALIGCSTNPGQEPQTCAASETLCGKECIDTATDPANCGACGTACKPGEVCGAGTCSLTCGAGSTQCGASCFDVNVDAKNCGACGKACNPGEVCSAGKCAAQCPAQQTLCVGDGGAVSCANTNTDATNCGACGTKCDAGKVCSAGKCADTCGVNEQLCKGMNTVYCAAVQTDNANCGSCGNACSNGQTCVGGKCTGNCGLNETLCPGGDAGAAYCAKTDTDQANCGACGTVCNNGNGEICVGGKCQVQCSKGLTQCGKECVDLKFNRDNCGGCNTPCPSGQVCSAGACSKSLCGNNVIDMGERCDNNVGLPPGGQVTCRPSGSKNECKFDFSAVPQLYCNGGCSWAGPPDCDQADADIYCKLIMGSTTSTATSFTVVTAKPVPGFSCPLGGYGTNYGPMPEYAVSVNVWYQGTSILQNHGPGNVIGSATCTP